MTKHIGVLTSGGDAPGMNAAIRSVVLAAEYYGYEVTGFLHGYNGLINDESLRLKESIVRGIISQGGTILKSARCAEFTSVEGVTSATKTLVNHNIDCLIVIGGDGSFKGMQWLNKHWSGQLLGIPGTIDNDVDGTDFTIGYSTAVNTCIDAIDKIRDTADAFERIFLVEVMGRHSGFIAMNVGIATAAEQVLTFETHQDPQQELNNIVEHITACKAKRGNSSYIIVVAEHLWPGGIENLAKTLSEQAEIDCQPCILGYIQRGGRPVGKDRTLATRMGVSAVSAIETGSTMKMLAEQNNQMVMVDIDDAVLHKKTVNAELLDAQNNILDIVKLTQSNIL